MSSLQPVADAIKFAAALGFCTIPYSHALAEEPEPIDQFALNRMLESDPTQAFLFAFDAGDELTEAVFTRARGVGANVTSGTLFTRYPRADLEADGEWAMHEPPREGGPQAQSCISCHSAPYANGAGPLAMNVAIDPLQTGDPTLYLERNTLHLFGLGAVQRLAEEMTAELQAISVHAQQRACAEQQPVTADLVTKEVSFGTITAVGEGAGDACLPKLDTSNVDGVDEDLVVRMFGWKGTHATIREFSRGAAHNEMGMQADELVGSLDGDFDGVTSELSVGDMTAMAIYIAALERPTTKLEMASHGLIDLGPEERNSIERGETLFAEIGCASCHKPTMELENPVYSEPSSTAHFKEPMMPSGQAAADVGLLEAMPISFDLTVDQPNNMIEDRNGQIQHLGAFERNGKSEAVIRWYSDFKRHDMGEALADPIDAYGFGASVWPTRSLAGVGSTGPWLHHGHATTLEDAILAHGGEADASKQNFVKLDAQSRADVIAFLENLVIVDLDAGEDEEDH